MSAVTSNNTLKDGLVLWRNTNNFQDVFRCSSPSIISLSAPSLHFSSTASLMARHRFCTSSKLHIFLLFSLLEKYPLYTRTSLLGSAFLFTSSLSYMNVHTELLVRLIYKDSTRQLNVNEMKQIKWAASSFTLHLLPKWDIHYSKGTPTLGSYKREQKLNQIKTVFTASRVDRWHGRNTCDRRRTEAAEHDVSLGQTDRLVICVFLVRFPETVNGVLKRPWAKHGALTSRLPPHTAAQLPSVCESVCVRGWKHNNVKCFWVLSAQRLSINAVHVPFITTPLHTQTIIYPSPSPGRRRVKCLACRHLNSRCVRREVCSLDHQDRRRRPPIRAPLLNTIARNIESCRFSLPSSRFRLLRSKDFSTGIVFRPICVQLLVDCCIFRSFIGSKYLN